MDDLDPHLNILLKDFIRLCPDDAPLEQDDWTGLYEICLFVHTQGIQCTASAIGEFLLRHGCSSRKTTFVSHQYRHFLNILRLHDERTHSPTMHLNEAGDGPREAAR
jgi:hypothetical protein